MLKMKIVVFPYGNNIMPLKVYEEALHERISSEEIGKALNKALLTWCNADAPRQTSIDPKPEFFEFLVRFESDEYKDRLGVLEANLPEFDPNIRREYK